MSSPLTYSEGLHSSTFHIDCNHSIILEVIQLIQRIPSPEYKVASDESVISLKLGAWQETIIRNLVP